MTFGEPHELRTYLAADRFIGLDATVLDFWAYAFGDLATNTRRGLVAEFLVARAVGAPSPVRTEWDPYDVEAPDRTKIEVKSGAYIQAWAQRKPSQITFSGLKARLLDPATGAYVGEPDYHADVYVFAVHTCQDHEAFDILDLTQWEFYVASREAVAATGYRSLGLVAVRRIAGEPVAYGELGARVAAVSRPAGPSGQGSATAPS
jgi:hypothetical protein